MTCKPGTLFAVNKIETRDVSPTPPRKTDYITAPAHRLGLRRAVMKYTQTIIITALA